MTTAESGKESGTETLGAKLNWLRAGVLGANDGIISTAGVLLGVAAAGSDAKSIFTAGIAAVSAGAVSMALGEYVSVSAQRDTEVAMVEKHRREVKEVPAELKADIVDTLMDKGMSQETAVHAAEEMAEKDLLAAHLDIRHAVSTEEFTNPWAAALSSAVSFLLGAVLPVIAAVVAPMGWKSVAILVLTAIALIITGTISARFSEGSHLRSVVRLVVGGVLAMGVTYGIGYLFGVAVG
ncbi:MAG: VIT family protein [Corynebacterium sp.]|nr:VIT family protein [Corynebacterium sp.]